MFTLHQWIEVRTKHLNELDKLLLIPAENQDWPILGSIDYRRDAIKICDIKIKDYGKYETCSIG